MRDFICPKCGQHLAFENSLCLSCGSPLGYNSEKGTLVIADGGPYGGPADVHRYRRCANFGIAQCNWLVDMADTDNELCASCRLTRTRPNDADTVGMTAYAVA
ncbi:hypothetical protein C6A85_96970, partial [Mycobacterium sp. ITM-2017-0098]